MDSVSAMYQAILYETNFFTYPITTLLYGAPGDRL
jgi:hypothetical protein